MNDIFFTVLGDGCKYSYGVSNNTYELWALQCMVKLVHKYVQQLQQIWYSFNYTPANVTTCKQRSDTL